jgi:1-phosphatidylinositol-4-phosphate 5-kinase
MYEQVYELTNTEFQAKFIYQLEAINVERKKKISYEFYDFAPKVFHLIRNFYGYSTESYLKSIGPENVFGSLAMGRINSLESQMSAGKSGSLFFYTADGSLMLKTISHDEFEHFKTIMKDYYYHLLAYPHTMVARFFGLHKIKFSDGAGFQSKRIYFVIMANVFNTTRFIKERFDLKGSTYGRQTKKEKEQDVPAGEALKD